MNQVHQNVSNYNSPAPHLRMKHLSSLKKQVSLIVSSCLLLALVSCQKQRLSKIESPERYQVKPSSLSKDSTLPEIIAQRMVNNQNQGFRILDPVTLNDWISANYVKVYDLNSENTQAKYSIIRDAKSVELKHINTKLLGANKNQTLVFYGHKKHSRAKEAANKAIDLGYKRSYILSGGIEAWESYQSKKP